MTHQLKEDNRDRNFKKIRNSTLREYQLLRCFLAMMYGRPNTLCGHLKAPQLNVVNIL